MKRVIFPVVRDGAKLVYPDSQELFSDTDTSTVPGEVIASYTGNLDLVEYDPENYTISDGRPKIVLTDIAGANYRSDDFSYFEVDEGGIVTFTGEMNIPDSPRPFSLPIKRDDTGRVIFAKASVQNQVMTATIKFPTSGLWYTNADLINSFRQVNEHLIFAGVTGVVQV